MKKNRNFLTQRVGEYVDYGVGTVDHRTIGPFFSAEELGTGAGFFCSQPYAEGSCKLNDYSCWLNKRCQIGFYSSQQVHKLSSG